MWLTEPVTAVGIVALLPLSLDGAVLLLPLIGVVLNGTSSVLYGTVADLVEPGAARARLRYLLHPHHRRGRGVAGDLRTARRVRSE